MARFYEGDRVELRYANTLKFETTTDGVKISGGLQDKDGDLGAPGQVLASTGSELDWVEMAPGTVTTIDVKQENYCGVDDTPLNPITVTPTSAGISTVSIAETSNAYGRKYVQDNDPTTTSGGNYVVCDGDIWYDTDGTNSSGFMPSGSIIMYNGDTAPSGWTLCDGTNGAPDLRDKFIVGSGSSYNRGDTGGSADAVLVEHNHSTSIDGGHVIPGNASTTYPYGGAGGYAASVFSMNNAGESGTNKNLPPYYALTFIMKL